MLEKNGVVRGMTKMDYYIDMIMTHEQRRIAALMDTISRITVQSRCVLPVDLTGDPSHSRSKGHGYLDEGLMWVERP